MSPSIRVDREVYAFLKKNAEPFVDTPNSVLRRLLDLEPRVVPGQEPTARAVSASRAGKGGARSRVAGKNRRSPAPGRARRGTLLAQDEYVEPLLTVLAEYGGSATVPEIIAAVEERLTDKLTATDRDRTASGAIRWQGRLQFVRLRLVDEGLLEKGSPRGRWSISADGRKRIGAEI